MNPGWHHRICARPMVICWVIGALILWTPTTVTFRNEGVFAAAAHDFWTLLLILLSYTSLAALGFWTGVIPLFWLVRIVCRWVNGGPFAVGDRVTVLSGPHAGMTSVIYEMTRGQDGSLMPRVDLGEETRARFHDICEDFTLLRIPARDGSSCGTDSSVGVS